MPDYTYLQAAQPTTAGHWALSFAYPALRDVERLRGDFEWVNGSPAGTGGVNGSRFALDRERLAELLGFTRPIEHTRDANWQTDGLADLTSHAAIAATGASRFAEDVELYGSEEFGLLRIGDELCRASALMPQKRNPYALVVLRGGAGTLIGRATGVLATQRTPSGRTDNLLYAYGEVAGAVDLAARLLRLAAAVAESVTVDAERAARTLRESGAMATDVAEAVSLATGLDYRSAYRAVASQGAEAAARDLDVDALDPIKAIASRTVPGGAAPEPMDAMLAGCRDEIARAHAWVERERGLIEDAEQRLVAGESRHARARCSCGLMPRTRLNAVLSANALPYPTCGATEPTVAPGSRSRSAASESRQPVRKVIGGSPTSAWKRRASAARETPIASARLATVHGCDGLLCSSRSAGPTTGSPCARYQPGASASGRANHAPQHGDQQQVEQPVEHGLLPRLVLDDLVGEVRRPAGSPRRRRGGRAAAAGRRAAGGSSRCASGRSP